MLWGIILVGEQQQELVRLRAEVAGHWTIVRIYDDQAVAWEDYQKSIKEGKAATWDVVKERDSRRNNNGH